MSGQGTKERAFAQRLHRNQTSVQSSSVNIPGDRRSQISRISFNELQSFHAGLITTYQDVVQPLDFEDFILQHQPLADDSAINNLYEFPDDDLEVTNIQRKSRTLGPDIVQVANDPLVKDCIKSYTDDWSIVNRKYQLKGFGKSKQRGRLDSTTPRLQKHEYEVDERKDDSKNNRSHLLATPRGSWASSIFDLQSCQPDPLLQGLLDNIPIEDIDKQNETFREKNRVPSIFSIFPQPEDEQFVTRATAIIPQEHVGQRILVRCTELKLELDIEPIFATMALYDCKLKRKISENFHFDMNQDWHKKMIAPYNKGKVDISTLAKSCIFSVTYPSNEVCLVVKLEKVLQQGDITECAEPYMKDTESQKGKEKARSVAEQFCARNGAYRMPFAWTAIHLVDVITGASAAEPPSQGDKEQPSPKDPTGRRSPDTGTGGRSSMRRQGEGVYRRASNSADVARPTTGRYERPLRDVEDSSVDLTNFRPISLTVSTFFKQESEKLSDDDLFKLLADLRRPNSLLRKLKCIQGLLKLDITPPQENLKYCLTPELIPVAPFPDKQGAPVKEIQEFAPREVYVPYVTYRNTLYIYPEFLNFSNRTGSARNIAVKVQFMEGEDQSYALPCIYGKSSGPEFVKEIFTPVVYHNKTPYFYEEVKVKLPPHLGEQHHFFFTFYHVSFKADSTGPIESTPVGYTWIPALKEGRLNLGMFELPVAADKLPQSYSMLATEVQLPNLKWVDGHKPVFKCSLQTESSVHPQDFYLHRFFRLCHTLEGRVQSSSKSLDGNLETNLRKNIKDLENAQLEPLVRFLHLVLNKLFTLLIRPTAISGTVANVSQFAFDTLAVIIHRVHELPSAEQDKHGHNNLLASYVSYIFNTPGSGTPLASPKGSPTTLPKHQSDVFDQSLLHQQQRKLSNSNPNIHEQSKGQKSISMVGESWMDDVMKEYSNVAANRNSIAESTSSRASHSTSQYPSRRKLVHEEIALQWAVAQSPYKERAMDHAWFYFSIMAKSMAQYLDLADKLFWNRKERFHVRFLDDIVALVTTIVTEIINKQEKHINSSRRLNTSLAFFLNDLLSLMDRGFVLNLVASYLKEIHKAPIEKNLIFLKLEFLHILCSHEHHVVLNLPFPTEALEKDQVSPSPSMNSIISTASSMFSMMGQEPGTIPELSYAFREQHFLVGQLLCELKNSFDTNDIDIMTEAVDVLKDLMSTHDQDSRYDNGQIRNRVASLYLPLVGIAMEVLPYLHGYESDRDEQLINESVAMAIANSSVLSKSSAGDLQSQVSTTKHIKLSLDTTRNFLMCCMWVLKNLGKDQLKQWIVKKSSRRLIQLLEVLDLGIKLFEYQPRKKAALASAKGGKNQPATTPNDKERLKSLENAIMNPSAASNMLRRRKEMENIRADRRDDSPKLRWKKDQTYWKRNTENAVSDEIQLEGNLSAEYSMITLDALELLVQSVDKSDAMKTVIDNCLRVLLHCFTCNQSIEVLQNMFATQRSILSKFPELVFEEETELCADLCYRLLTHCSSSSHLIRAQASASLYLLMRQNYEIGNNFARVKMQVTMSLSSLVGSECFNEDFLRRSLKTIITYAQADQHLKQTPFPEQVRELVFNLHMILSDTVKMKEFEEDREMFIDLQYRIAKGYQNSPDLRLTWLQNMAKDHTKYHNYTEAGMCLVHSAALVAEYLSMLEDKRHLPVGCVDFTHVSTNVIEESAVSDDVISPGEEGICTGKYFSETGLMGLLEHAVHMFKNAQMHELINEVEKLLIPILEARREFKKLMMLHTRLAEAYNKIISTAGKRMMGTYFRVAFYGSLFADIDTEEFIYKEPAITKLPEISNRLQSFYADKFGSDRIEIIKDSNVVDPKKLDYEKGYIQITYVEPYFLEYEQETRETYFEQNNDLRRFIFVTPFTPSGKAHGELANQYKRKTILTVANAFPYIKTRINVIQREELVLTPIEVAIEDVQSKIDELKKAMPHSKPDVKMLQMVLQGCIGTTVNQGPFEIANVFLSDFEKDRNGVANITRHHHKLRLCFKEFVKRCSDALSLNKSLISQDQRAYQKELERNYTQFVEKLEPLLKSKFGQLRGSLRREVSSQNKAVRPVSLNIEHQGAI